MIRLSKTGRFVSTALMLSALMVGSVAAQPRHGPPPRPVYRHGPPPRYYGGHGGDGTGAFIGGALLGLGAGALIGSALAPPPAVVYSAPPPGYYQAPPPVYYGY